MNKKVLQFLCIGGVVFLVALYVATLIFAIIQVPGSAGLFKASIYCTIVVPVFLYAISMVYKLMKNKEAGNKEEDN